MKDVCPNCGSDVKKTNRFCSTCGFDLQPIRRREQSVIREHEAPAAPKPPSAVPKRPGAGPRQRKATVLGLPSVLPPTNAPASESSSKSAPPPPPAAPPARGDKPSHVRTFSPPARKISKQTMIGVPYDPQAVVGVATADNDASADAGADSGADTVAAASAPAPVPVPASAPAPVPAPVPASAPVSVPAPVPASVPPGSESEAPRPSYRARANVRFEEHFEPPMVLERRKRFFMGWGALIALSLAWLVFRYLEAHG